MREDWSDEVMTVLHSELGHIKELVNQMSEELQGVVQQVRPLGSRWTLAEVMCSENSPLTQQVQQSGKSAFRFGLAQGDLSEVAGRQSLFRMLAQHRPKHIWYSPVCGPWSSWSQLNASRSLQHQQDYQQRRRELLYQLALGITLYRHQVGHGDHFHWEQPRKSLMFKNPCLNEVYVHAQACEFDMCRAGRLTDPESGLFMKKAMTVLTTFAPLYEHFHGMCCDHSHQHQPIEGSCKLANGKTTLRTKYTEVYPRKFARTTAQLLSKGGKWWPFNWQFGMACRSNLCKDRDPNDEALVIKSQFRQKPQFDRSELMTPQARATFGSKRLKSEPGQGNAPTFEMCQEVIQEINQIQPRVGKREITDSEIVKKIQNIFPDKCIIRILACRGMERTMEPPKGLHPQEAPYRKALILRRDGGIQHEKYWERWDNLSKRQLSRPSHSCRINITAFAQDHAKNETITQREFHSNDKQEGPKTNQSNISQESTMSPLPNPEDLQMTPSSHHHQGDLDEFRPSNAEREESSCPPTSEEVSEAVPEATTSDPSTVADESMKGKKDQGTSRALEHAPEASPGQQGFRFRSLPGWEQQAIIRMHKNLGHPSNDRLARALQVNGARPDVVQAALEIKCAACAASMPPKHSRPATLKSMLDFNHKIYLDGVTWTNKQGKNFHFYHVLDAGSNYHMAIGAPAKSSQDLISILSQHWISWAGPPAELVVDSGTEMNSEAFSAFCQRFNIRCTTTVPDAHWQSGKIERHGAFLETMLSRIDQEIPIHDYSSLQLSLNQCTHAKNALSIRHGFAPEIIVFGRHSRIPGSVLSDESRPAHEVALQEDQSLGTTEFKQLLTVREAARKAFHEADNSDVLRRASLRRSCPSRGNFQKGNWVMIWRNNPLQQNRWVGPLRVIIQDDRHTVWCTAHGQLYRSAPENTRLALAEEGQPEGAELPEDITPLMQQITRMQNQPERYQETEAIPTDNIPRSSNLHHPDEPNNPQDTSPYISQDESLAQPDQEPENPSSGETQSNPEEPQPESSGENPEGDSADLVQLLCHEYANALACEDHSPMAWRCEFDINLSEEFKNHQPSETEAWNLLATTAKKARSEVRLSSLSPAELKEFEQAKDAEIQNWIKTSTISAVMRNQIPEDQILRCRWILTWKPLDNVGEEQKPSKTTKVQRTHKAKARLVVLGYLDPRIEEIPRDSPTLNKTSRMLALQVIASHSWSLRSFDIKAAFLQGTPQEGRVIAVDPVPELRKALSLKPHEICRLNKSAYGLIDAPYLWYCALVSELVRLGFEASPFDPCCFVLRSKSADGQQSQLEGILGIHVDDGIGGGSAVFEDKIKQLEKTFPFGSHKVSAFTFTGIEINQHHDHSITLNQSAYVRKINPIAIESNRKSQPELPVTESERLALRGLVGSLQYAAINTRPDLSSKLSFLQSSINQATIETLMDGNRVLHEAKKHHEVTITIKPIPHQHLRFMAFSDASFSSAKKPDSHAGSIIVSTHQDITNNCECPLSPLTWGCRKIQKVVTSTLSAETMALASTLDQLSWLRLYWSWIHDPSVNWKQPETTLTQLAPAITVPTLQPESDMAITDCKSLYDLVTRTAPPSCSEFRVSLMARAIKESLREGTSLRWVPSGAQLADALTKAMESNFLRETLKYGRYRLCDEESTLRERAKTKDRLKWLKGQTANPKVGSH